MDEGLFKTFQAKSKVKGKGEDLFDISVYNNKKSTERFHQMITELSDLARDAIPTAFHETLKALAEDDRLMRLYSQNIDCLDTSIQPLATNIPLNMEAPWPVTIQLHGGLDKIQCTKCSHIQGFDKLLFQGPEAPLCKACAENDRIRTEQNGKRSHGIGRLTPRVVLYHGPSPDAEAIGKVSQADLRSVPNVVIVVGTSLTIPGVKKLVRELCQATRSKKHGLTAWLNVDPPPQETNNLWNFVIRGKCDDFAVKLNLLGTTSDIQVAEEEEDFRIVTSPTDHRIVEGPESPIWKGIQDIKHTGAMKASHGRMEKLRSDWRNMVKQYCEARIESGKINQRKGGREECSSNDLKVDELHNYQDQHEIRSDGTSDDGTAYFAPWVIRNLPPKLVCDCVTAEFDTNNWGTPRAVIQLRRTAEIITRKWVLRSHGRYPKAHSDIDTSSDDFKLKVVALFFGIHSLRKAAFWKNIGALGLSEANFVPFYGNILQKALRRERAAEQSGGVAWLCEQHPTTRVCCLAQSSELKYRLTIEPQDADFREEIRVLRSPETTHKHSNTSLALSPQLSTSQAYTKSRSNQATSVANPASERGGHSYSEGPNGNTSELATGSSPSQNWGVRDLEKKASDTPSSCKILPESLAHRSTPSTPAQLSPQHTQCLGPTKVGITRHSHITSQQDPIDLTQDTAGPAQPYLFAPLLPFLPQDLERLKCNNDQSGWLNDCLMNTFAEYFTSVASQISTMSSGAWDCQDSTEWTLPCHESSTFALQINVNNKHWVLLRIYVGPREAVLFDPNGPTEDNNDQCLQLARRFVTNRLPDPYNDWDKGWHIAHPTKILQQSNSYDCGLCCIIMTAYDAAGIDAPSSIDSKLYRLFLLALGTNVNFVHVASRGGQYSDVPVAGPLRLWDMLSDKVAYEHEFLGLSPDDMDAASATLASANTLQGNRELQSTMRKLLQRQQEAANYHIDACVSKLRSFQAALQQLTTLMSAIENARSSLTDQLQDPLHELQHDETLLRDMIKSAKGLKSNVVLRSELESKIKHVTKNIACQRGEEIKRRERLVCLRRAVEEVDMAAAGQHIEVLIQQYLRDHQIHEDCSLSTE
ncbi:hypothetical protein F5883DRAFT_512549 [Diaporthe sp. PMI_573]|nr:hypothetical protein F5883DRAFT_512549 [Diaporthaceae sp. PMI_573]